MLWGQQGRHARTDQVDRAEPLEDGVGGAEVHLGEGHVADLEQACIPRLGAHQLRRAFLHPLLQGLAQLPDLLAGDDLVMDVHSSAVAAEQLALLVEHRKRIEGHPPIASVGVEHAELGTELGVTASADFMRSRQLGTSQDFNLLLGAENFELDVFGRLRSLSHRARELYFGSQAQAASTVVPSAASTAV